MNPAGNVTASFAAFTGFEPSKSSINYRHQGAEALDAHMYVGVSRDSAEPARAGCSASGAYQPQRHRDRRAADLRLLEGQRGPGVTAPSPLTRSPLWPEIRAGGFM